MNTRFCISCKTQLHEKFFYPTVGNEIYTNEIIPFSKCKLCIDQENNNIAADFKAIKEQKPKNSICL